MTKDELISNRDALIKMAGISWKELESLGKAFQLDDDRCNIYRSIKSISWQR